MHEVVQQYKAFEDYSCQGYNYVHEVTIITIHEAITLVALHV